MLDLAIIEETDVTQAAAEGIYDALFEFFTTGGSKTKCLDEHTSHQVYYRMRKSHPEVLQRIEDSARIDALLDTFGDDIAFRAAQKVVSRDVQMQAMLTLRDQNVIGAMADVALGKLREVDMGDGEVKQIVAYPRDQVEAVRRLQELARGGVLPEQAQDLLHLLSKRGAMEEEEEIAEEKAVTLQQLGLGITPDFTRITAQTADGTTYTAEVKRGQVIDAEYEEVTIDGDS
jgi:hypothetical protein